MSKPIDHAREALFPREGRVAWHVYAVLDGARDPRVRRAVEQSGLPYACLYAGALPEVMLEIAPWLVKLTPDAPLNAELLDVGWRESWGIFVLANASLEELRRHFRRFLKVRDEAGRSMIFRFYDPRVMRVYLPTCNAGELAFVFGPVSMFVMPGERGAALRFHRDAASLGVQEIAPAV